MTNFILPVVGRDSEMESFIRLVGRGHGNLSFHGIAGSGKTTVLKAFQRLLNRNNDGVYFWPDVACAYIDTRYMTDATVLAEHLINQVWQNAESRKIEISLQSSRTLDEINYEQARLTPQVQQSVIAGPGSVVSNVTQSVSLAKVREQVLNQVQLKFEAWIRQVASQCKVCLLLDTLELSSDEVHRFIEAFSRRCEDHLIVITAGRSPQGSSSIPLPPIPESAIKQDLLEKPIIFEATEYYIPRKTHAAILRLSRGNGLCLQLLISNVLVSEDSDFNVPETDNTGYDIAYVATSFWNRLLREIHHKLSTSRGEELVRYKRIYSLLRYVPSLFYFDPQLLYEVLRDKLDLKELFPNVLAIRGTLGDPVVSLHVQRVGRRLQFHDLVREIGDVSLYETDPATYTALHRRAAEFFIDGMRTNSDDDEGAIPAIWLERPLSPVDGPVEFRTLRWDKKRWRNEELWPSVNWFKLFGTELRFQNWRENSLALAYHVIRFSDWLGVKFIDTIFAQGTSRRETPFYNQLIETTRFCPVTSPQVYWWLTFMRGVYKSAAPQNVLDLEAVDEFEKLLQQDFQVVPLQLRMVVVHWLLLFYVHSAPGKVSTFLEYALDWEHKIPRGQGAGFWRALGNTMLQAGKKDEGIELLRKSLDDCIDPRERADSLLRLGIQLRKSKGDLEESRVSLMESKQLWEQLDDIVRQGEVHIALGDICMASTDLQSAKEKYEYAIKLLELGVKQRTGQVGILHAVDLLALALINAAKIDHASTDVEAVRRKLERMYEISTFLTSDRKARLVSPLLYLGQLYEETGDKLRALSRYESAAQIARDNDKQEMLIIALCRRAALLERQGETSAANHAWKEVRALTNQTKETNLESWIFRAETITF